LCIAVSLTALLSACAATKAEPCNLDQDCPSGRCRADGTCAPQVDASAGGDADGAVDATAPLCTPNHDGIIGRDEFPLEVGRSATYRVGLDVDVNTAGLAGPNQTRVWDFSAMLQGDQDVHTELRAVTGTWFADSFPGASYITRLSALEDLDGVFELTDDALLLRGVVSPLGGTSRTELVYDPPVPVVGFPLQKGASWSISTTISGVAQGVPSVYTESYDFLVDADGELTTPYGTFPVLRVRVDLTRTVGALVTTKHSFAFIAECFTTVANVSSKDYEPDIEFDRAAELRRLAP